MDTLPCLMIFFSMEDFKTIGGIQKDIQYCQLCVCGSIYEYFKERSVTFCAETHSCHVWSSSKNRETKMGLGSSKLNISELFFFSASLGRPLGLVVIEISLIFKSVFLLFTNVKAETAHVCVGFLTQSSLANQY